jgi:hypothetical protein
MPHDLTTPEGVLATLHAHVIKRASAWRLVRSEHAPDAYEASKATGAIVALDMLAQTMLALQDEISLAKKEKKLGELVEFAKRGGPTVVRFPGRQS